MAKVKSKTPDYFSTKYLYPTRLVTYGYQINEVARVKPQNILEIGIGNGIVSYVLRKFGFSVRTLDIDENLKPDIVASVLDMPLEDDSFDLVLCCEVLEHIPFSDFTIALSEIHRVARHVMVLTIPDEDRYWKIDIKIPKIRINWNMEFPFRRPKEHNYDGEHYWEIGKKGYPLCRISNTIVNAGFSIEKTYRIMEHPNHRMFVVHKQ